MDSIDKDSLAQIDNLLAANQQAWLFGAGISRGAKIPLMAGLTHRILSRADSEDKPSKTLLDIIKAQLPDDAHIEQILSHLGDYATMAERSREKSAQIGAQTIQLQTIHDLHNKILLWISETIRFGYVSGNAADAEQVGTREKPIVEIKDHVKFVTALFNRNQAGVADRRRAVKFFTTNYDTLLEDALSLNCLSYWDGFAGGAVAYRCHRYGQNEPDPGSYRAHLVKLHGSIDWHLSDDDRVYRVRDGDGYPTRNSRVLIYPQATKYLATQRDPFSSQFDLLRRGLSSTGENVLAVCGYSFSDDHINQEIELAMQRPENKTTILAFSSAVGPALKRWQGMSWANRLHIVTEGGHFVGTTGPFAVPTGGKKHDWWTFEGITKILTNGAEACAA